jgi:hypothetical protein
MELSSLVIEITDGEARHSVGSMDGRSWDFWSQQAYAATGEAYPHPFSLRLPDKAQPYAPGFYLLAAGCIRTGKSGVTFMQGYGLVPVADAVKQLQALPRVGDAGAARAPAARAVG